ncbi:zinc-binding alcohol dehydrogenase/oxidoreductase [Amphibacillus marinus]|uniref:Zinc-binding alcohol dehydrogenase/oxidoreductase n=1 Tax=Amphibacillus marinus TaxID=872970 RepID=A0A1H8ICN8_9BACI|nr:NAD(P)-dependent alcohol dehydrogenase [Amphibacillus marinus]SEN65947.1 zinc-binding alcohol dehydrogenase/oxidoreductase [Amphibacillus marinus]
MKAFVHKGTQILSMEMNKPSVSVGQLLIKMHSVGLNRRDLMIPARRGEQPEPVILGSDGVGIVEEIGSAVRKFKKGDRVIVNPGMGWEMNTSAAPETLEIVGYPSHGTFAEYYLVDQRWVEPMPSYLAWDEASVLALAALTAYRALFTKGKLAPNQTVFIPGIGSGVATFLLQFAKAAGANVIASSRSAEKRARAEQLGADLVIDTNQDWKGCIANRQIDLVIDSIGYATFHRSLEVLKPGGTLVTFGATTEDNVTFNVRNFFYAQQQIIGSTLGSREELREMLTFIEQHSIRPVVDSVYAFESFGQAFEHLKHGKQFGNISVKIIKE